MSTVQTNTESFAAVVADEATMSLDTLLEAARFLDEQEMKELQESPPRPIHVPTTTVSAPPPVIFTPIIRIKEPVLASTSPPTIHIQNSPTIPTHRIIHNSFDIINPLVIDEGGEAKRKQPPMVFRSGTREVHNKLEKHRRAHLKECFDLLKKQLPNSADSKKTSNLSILHAALRYIQSLKRREREVEQEMERLAREKIAYQQKLAILKKEVTLPYDMDFSNLLPEAAENRVTSLQDQLPLLHDELMIKDEPHVILSTVKQQQPTEIQVSLNNDLRLTKSITRSVPVVTTNTVNGLKEGMTTQQVQTTSLSVLPMGYPLNQGLVLVQKGGITDLSQLVSSNPQQMHFITTTPQQLNGKVVPLMNAQYLMKPVVVVSTPSRPS